MADGVKCPKCRRGIMLYVKGTFYYDTPLNFWACNVCYKPLSALGGLAPILHYSNQCEPSYELPKQEHHWWIYDVGHIQTFTAICGNSVTILPQLHATRVKLGDTIIPVHQVVPMWS